MMRLLALSLAGAALTGWAWWVAATPLEEPAARALAAELGVDPAQVHVARVRLRGGLALDGVRVGGLTVAHAEIDFDPAAALRGRAQIAAVRARDVRSALGAVREIDVRRRGADGRLVARDVTLRWRGWDAQLAEAAVEIDGGQPRRAAFEGGRAFGLDGLAASASADADGAWSVRVARRNATLTARVAGTRWDARVELDRLAAPPARWPFGIDPSRATLTGTVEAHGLGDRAAATVALAVADLALDNPSVAPRRIEHLSPRIDGAIEHASGALQSEGLTVRLGPATLVLSGHADGETFDVTGELESIGCGELLAALPRALLPALDGMVLDGALAGRVHLAAVREELADLLLDDALKIGCRVRVDAPLADPSALKGPIARAATDEHGGRRPFVLGPANPSWRPLAALPPTVVHTFLAAEDGRFFRHHGFDEEMIRRAIAADLGAGRFERGASTISQQVVKNLLLSGERTAARKLEEAVLAWRLEQVVDKRRILELYLNMVELGPGAYGVAEGSERYFGKEPDQLTVDEAAQLAALLPAPRRGMDAAWQKRYQALSARLPSEKVYVKEAVPGQPNRGARPQRGREQALRL